MTVPQIRATHATRVVDLTARQQQNLSLVKAWNEALRPVETEQERIERLAENLYLSIEQRHNASHRAGQPIEECLDFICTDLTELRRAAQ